MVEVIGLDHPMGGAFANFNVLSVRQRYDDPDLDGNKTKNHKKCLKSQKKRNRDSRGRFIRSA